MQNSRGTKAYVIGILLTECLCVSHQSLAQQALPRALRQHLHVPPLKPSAPAGQTTPPPTSIIVDTTLNPLLSGPITASGGTTYNISTSYGVTSGANEFFSFSTFNLGTGDTANFSAAGGINNIISRVTGGTPSSIDGTINSPVSFWFINPAGLIMTQNAAVHVTGTLALGAADIINFNDGTSFYGSPANGTSTALTSSTAVPASFGFLTNSQAGSFTSTGWSYNADYSGEDIDNGKPVPALFIAGNSVSMTGSSLSLFGTQFIPGGCCVVFLPMLSTVTISSNNGDISLSNSPITAGTVSLIASKGNISVAGSAIAASVDADETGGNLEIEASNGNVTIDYASSLVASSGQGQGTILITANTLTMGDPNHLTNGTLVQNLSGTFNGAPGDIVINTVGAANFYGTVFSSLGEFDGIGGTGFECGACDNHVVNGDLSIVAGSLNANSASFSTTANNNDQQESIGGNIFLTATAGNLTLINSSLDASSSSTGGCCGIGVPGFISLSASRNITLQDSTLTTSITAQDPSQVVVSPTGTPLFAPGTINLSAGQTVSLTTSALASNATTTSADAGPINISGSSVQIIGGQITAKTLGSGNAGDITITTTGSDPVGGSALQISGGATISSDANQGLSSSANAGAISLVSQQGSVQIGLAADAVPTTVSSSAAGSAGIAGTVTITSGAGISLGNASVATTASGSAQGQPGTISLTANSGNGPLSIANSTLNASTSGPQTGGEIDLIGGAISTINSNILSQTSGPSDAGEILINGATVNMTSTIASVSTSNSGNAGAVKITASGTDQGGVPALQISGGSSISSDATDGTEFAAAGLISLTASQGTVQVGLPSDATQTSISSSAGSQAGIPGNVTINGMAIALGKANLATTAAGGGGSEPASITLTANGGSGALSVANSTINTTTSGDLSFDDITLSGGAVSVTNSNLVSQTTGAGNAGRIFIDGSTINMTGSQVTASTSGNGVAGDISLHVTGTDPSGGSALSISSSTIESTATGTATTPASMAGTITLAADNGSVSIGGSDEASATRITTSANPFALQAGTITVTAGSGISLGNADLETLADGQNVNGAKGNISLNANSGNGPLSIASSTLNASTSGSQVGGEIDLNGGALTVSDSNIFSKTTGPSNAGQIVITGTSVNMTGTQAVVSTSNSGNAGAVKITANGADQGGVAALQITDGSTISSDASAGTNGANAGAVTLTATQGSVQIGAPSDGTTTIISTAAGVNAGAAGIIDISGQNISLAGTQLLTTVSTPDSGSGNLQYLPASVTLSSVQEINLSDSLIDTRTSGGVDAGLVSITGGSVSIIGGQQPAPTLVPESNLAVFSATTSAANAGNIIITASDGPFAIKASGDSGTGLIATSYGAGIAGNISISANGVTAGVPGQIVTNPIGSKGVLIESAAQGNGTGGNVTIAGGSGAVNLDGAFITTEDLPYSSGIAGGDAGNISISGGTVQIFSSTVTTRTAGVGKAGTIDITASAADTSSGAALSIAGGSNVTSDASQDQSGASADEITLLSAGSIQVGLVSDTSVTSISTSAGAGAGSAGAITLTAGAGISLANASVTTTAGGVGASAAAGIPSAITLSANNGTGPLSIVNSTLDATTSGAQTAGKIDVEGSTIVINNTNIASGTSSASAAGDINITGQTVSIGGGAANGSITVSTTGPGNAGDISIVANGVNPSGGSALQVSGTTVQSTAAGSATAAAGNAGAITLSATNGSVNLGGTTPSTATQVETSANASAGAAGKINVSGSSITLDGADVSATIAGGSSATPGANIVMTSSGAITVESGAHINANTSGGAPGGSIQLVTPGDVIVSGAGTLISSNTSGNGVGGDISFGSPAAPIASLVVNTGSALSANASGPGPSAGKGGAILINSAGPIALQGAGTTLSSQSSNDAIGGSVILTGSSLTMSDGAVITADTSSNAGTAAPAGARTAAVGSPAASNATQVTGGNISVTTSGDVSLDGEGTSISARATGTGSGGTVTIAAANLAMSSGSQITTTASNLGNAGSITINLDQTPAAGAALSPTTLTDSQILTSASESTGGNIVITTNGSPLTLSNSVIAASSQGGEGSNGGNITLTGFGQTILEGSGILAQAVGGNGGAINLNLQPNALFIQDADSLVSATSKAGNNGTVTINAPQTDLNSALAPPDVSVSKKPELSSNACRRNQARSTFVREGRGGVATDPQGYLTAATTEPESAKLHANTNPAVDARVVTAALIADVGCH